MNSCIPFLRLTGLWTVSSCNTHAAELLETEPDRLVGQSILAFCGYDHGWADADDDDGRAGDITCIRRDITLTSATGRKFWARAQLRMRRRKDGSCLPLAMTFIDVDDLYCRSPSPAPPGKAHAEDVQDTGDRTERQHEANGVSARREKLPTVRDVIHELNNALSIISVNCAVILRTQDPNIISKKIDRITAAVERGRKTTDLLLNLPQQEPIYP